MFSFTGGSKSKQVKPLRARLLFQWKNLMRNRHTRRVTHAFLIISSFNNFNSFDNFNHLAFHVHPLELALIFACD